MEHPDRWGVGQRPLPAVVVNIKDSVYGRIFTRIHEFEHVLLNRGGICDVDEAAENDHEDVEIFRNHLAGATIVPGDVLLRSEHVAGKRGPTTWQDVTRASDLWVHAPLDDKQRLQQLFFPEGLAYDGVRFNRTAITAPLSTTWRRVGVLRKFLVDQNIASWNRAMSWLRQVDQLSRVG